MKTVHISIGNSDDKLTQLRWSQYVDEVDRLVDSVASVVHGRWMSLPNTRYQNACWAFEVMEEIDVENVKKILAGIAFAYDQDSIAWNESETEMIIREGVRL